MHCLERQKCRGEAKTNLWLVDSVHVNTKATLQENLCESIIKCRDQALDFLTALPAPLPLLLLHQGTLDHGYNQCVN